MSSPKSKPFRAYVPVILNGRLVRWYFDNGEKKITMFIPMRNYPDGPNKQWMPKYVSVTFDKRMKTHQPYKTKIDESLHKVVETFYTCDNNLITFEEETVPVISY